MKGISCTIPFIPFIPDKESDLPDFVAIRIEPFLAERRKLDRQKRHVRRSTAAGEQFGLICRSQNSLWRPGHGEKQFQQMGTGAAIFIAAVFFVLALLAFPYGRDIFGRLQLEHKLTFAQVIVSFFGFIGAISAFTFAIIQYRKAEKWKRMQFVADEVRTLEADPAIANALLMIDWVVRKINLLLVPEAKVADLVKITRDMQWRALLPHTLKQKHPEYQAKTRMDIEGTSGEIAPARDLGFEATEVRIRDTYDALLTRLDRLETFIDADLIRAEELRPFIFYWIDAMTALDGTGDNATWRCTLLTYIEFYKYTGVKELFGRFGKNIDADGDIYRTISASVPDRELAGRLYSCASIGER